MFARISIQPISEYVAACLVVRINNLQELIQQVRSLMLRTFSD